MKILIIVSQSVANVTMIFKRHSSDDPGRYNVPKIGEIAVELKEISKFFLKVNTLIQ